MQKLEYQHQNAPASTRDTIPPRKRPAPTRRRIQDGAGLLWRLLQRRSLGHSCLWHARQRSQRGVPPLLLLQETPSKTPQRPSSVSERKSVRNTCWQQGHRGVEERVARAREAGHQTRTLSQAELNGERTKFVFSDCLLTCVSTPLTIEVSQRSKQRI